MGDGRQELSKRFLSEGVVVSAPVFDRVVESGISVSELISHLKSKGVWLLTDEILGEFVSASKQVNDVVSDISDGGGQATVEVSKSRRVYAKELASDLKILDDFDVSGKSSSSGVLEDFVECFNERYKSGSKILRERVDYRSPVPISRLKSEKMPDEMRIICMVSGKRESEKGNRFLEVEDPSGELTVLLPRDKLELKRAYDSILLDEVVGISGRLSKDIFVAGEITKPDLPLNFKPKRSEVDVSVAFLSDTHVGSYLFLEREFDSFLRWLEGEGDKREVAEKIKYVVVAGDLVDGIGIYPQQEKELTIPDVAKQYDLLALLLSRIPDYIEVVLSVGNHDAVRNAEPQPKLPKEFCERLYELPNVHMVGNPSMISTHGVETLIYHGTSLDTIIGSLSDCTYSAPEKAMVEYLRRRSLVPTYGSDGIAPENRDYLSINRIPDVLHCGHVHTNGYTIYHGVSVINSGTFQGKTKYQEELGHTPTPARVPVMNLESGELSVLYFGAEGGS